MILASSGWKADQAVDAVVHSDPVDLGTLTADSTGAVSGSLTIPSTLAPGDHTLELSGTDVNGATRTLSVALIVTDPSATAANTSGISSLARTGAEIMHTVWSGYWVLVAGALLLVAAVRGDFGRPR